MRAVPLAIVALVTLPAVAAPLEVELGGGLGRVLYGSYPYAPVVTARLGAAASGFRPGFRIFGAVGPAGGDAALLPGATGKSGYQALAFLLDLRYAASFFYASGGMGIGQVFSLQRSLSFEQFPLTGSPNVAAQANLGIRTSAYPRVGLESGLTLWSGIKREGRAGAGPGVEDGIRRLGAHLLFTLAFGG